MFSGCVAVDTPPMLQLTCSVFFLPDAPNNQKGDSSKRMPSCGRQRPVPLPSAEHRFCPSGLSWREVESLLHRWVQMNPHLHPEEAGDCCDSPQELNLSARTLEWCDKPLTWGQSDLNLSVKQHNTIRAEISSCSNSEHQCSFVWIGKCSTSDYVLPVATEQRKPRGYKSCNCESESVEGAATSVSSSCERESGADCSTFPISCLFVLCLAEQPSPRLCSPLQIQSFFMVHVTAEEEEEKSAQQTQGCWDEAPINNIVRPESLFIIYLLVKFVIVCFNQFLFRILAKIWMHHGEWKHVLWQPF